MKRLLSILLCACLLLSLFAVSALADEPAKIRVWAHWGSEQRRPTINKIIEQFNEKYAGQIEAEYVYVPFDELETKLIAAVSGGNPPDVVITAIEAVNVKAMRKQASDITDYLDPETQGKFYDRYWQTALYEDRVYALPFNTDTRMLYYNKTMFEEAGVDAAAILTWDDLLAAADLLDAKFNGADNYKAAFLPQLGNFGFDSVAVSNGGTIFDNPMNPDVCTLDSQANIEALTYMQTWNQRYGKNLVQSMLDNSGSGAQDYFISGQVAIFGQTCNYIATLNKYGVDEAGNWIIDYGTIEMPVGPSWKEGDPRAVGGGFVATVPYGVKDIAAATKFAEFMTCGEAASIWVVEQKDVMCAITPNELPELAGSVGWDMTLALLNDTQTARRHIYCPDAATSKDQQVNRIVKDFEDGVTPEEVLKEGKSVIDGKIESDKFIFGVN